MDLGKLLNEFNSSKNQIREKTLFRNPSSEGHNGIEMATNYSSIMEYAIKSLFDMTSEELNEPSGIGAFVYGSIGRREMISESDIDVLLIYKDNDRKYGSFKERFKELAKPFKFCKIDLPEWGTVQDAKIFASKSITEGNQVLECRYICGDRSLKGKIREIQGEFGNPDRMTRNIVFQKFYFDQYFKQRVRDGCINIKYCDGGSRDYLFINWFNQLMSRKYSSWNKSHGERPVAENGLNNLYRNGLLTSLEFGRAIEALNFNLLFRDAILQNNKGTDDEGLTFLDPKTLQEVYLKMPEIMDQYNISSPEKLKKEFDKQRFHISAIKKRIWDLMISEQGKSINKKWAEDFKKAYSKDISEVERSKLLSYDDSLIKIGLIWGASNSNQVGLLRQIEEKEKDSDSWEIQASLTTSPHCSSKYLHHIGTGIGKEKGYGYILRIVSRNHNVKKETLESIAYDPQVESRYKQCAKAELEDGKGTANHQI